jgi:hypothetical protein
MVRPPVRVVRRESSQTGHHRAGAVITNSAKIGPAQADCPAQNLFLFLSDLSVRDVSG